MTAAAPHGLDLVIDYVNTLDPDAGTDALASASGVVDWFAGRGLLTRDLVDLGANGREQAVRLREALRALMLEHNGGPHDERAGRELELVARRGDLGVHFDADGAVRLQAASGDFAGALAALLVPVASAAGDGSWLRVKACRASDCRWAFYDRSRNRSGVWCEMAVCGNRTKVRAYRRRASQRP
jgi:predicted RNA-binding Zn ribbon-like protein